jgi:hypothetical protein
LAAAANKKIRRRRLAQNSAAANTKFGWRRLSQISAGGGGYRRRLTTLRECLLHSNRPAENIVEEEYPSPYYYPPGEQVIPTKAKTSSYESFWQV